MPDSTKKTDDQKFNETLRRMLKTPPKPHVEPSKPGPKPERATAIDQKPSKKTDS